MAKKKSYSAALTKPGTQVLGIRSITIIQAPVTMQLVGCDINIVYSIIILS